MVRLFVVSWLANLYVAGQFCTAEQALVAAASQMEIDLAACGEVPSKELLELCARAQSREKTWVNFTRFGMRGLTLIFVVAQAFYLTRHISDPADPEEINLICITPSLPRTKRTA